MSKVKAAVAMALGLVLGLCVCSFATGLPVISDFVAVSAGAWHSVMLKNDGTVYASGWNGVGQIGDGTSTDRHAPVLVSGLTNIARVSTKYCHCLAVDKWYGNVWAWGWNGNGQLGDGTTTDKSSPVAVSGFPGGYSISAGGDHSAAVAFGGTVWCWGSNDSGGLGDGTTTQRLSPVQVVGLEDVDDVACGDWHTVALKRDGTVWSWGYNSNGELGDGTNNNRTLPVQVSGLSGIIQIAVGFHHGVAVKNDGTIWTWGKNGNGELGDGTTTNRNAPVQVLGISNVYAVSAGNHHTVALKWDGTVWAWGDNANGDLGDGTTIQRLTPVQVFGLTAVGSISAGSGHSAAVKGDGSAWAWGDNGSGQLGDGTTTQRTVPVRVYLPDITPPTLDEYTGGLTINRGAAATPSTTVSLAFSATDDSGTVSDMRISNDGVFDTEPWEPYATTRSWAVTSGDGTKTVYVRFRDASGNESDTATAAIVLDTTPPVNDTCGNAIVITALPYGQTLDVSGATPAGDPVASSDAEVADGAAGVWLRYTSTTTGYLEADTVGSTVYTWIGVYTGDCGSLAEVASAVEGQTSPVIFPVTAGVTYRFLVGGFHNPSSLHFNLHVPALPAIQSVSPSSGGPGARVQVGGQNLIAAQNLGGATQVFVNGRPAIIDQAPYTDWFDFVVPDGATTGPLTVVTPWGTAVSPGALTVTAPPTNDACADAVVIGSLPFTDSRNTVGAQVGGDPIPSCADTSFGKGVWYKYTAGSTGYQRATLQLDGHEDPNLRLAVYAGTCGSLSEIACAQQCNGGLLPLVFPTTAGTTYYLLAGTVGSESGTVRLNVITEAAPVFYGSVGPDHGQVTDTINVGGNYFSGATDVRFGGVSAKFSIIFDDVIYAIVPPGGNGPVTVTTPGGTVAAPGIFTVDPPTPVTNDDCEHAIDMTQLDHIVQDTSGASSVGDPVPSCVPSFGKGVWYRYQSPPAEDTSLDISTAGSTFDTVLAVYTGSPGSLQEALCNDDDPTANDGTSKIQQFCVPQGMTIWILAGGKNGASGFLRVTLHSPRISPFDIGDVNLTGANFSTGSGGVSIGIGGPAPKTDYAQISVAGTVSIKPADRLNTSLMNGFLPCPGQTFEVLVVNGTLYGDFGVKNFPAIPGMRFDTAVVTDRIWQKYVITPVSTIAPNSSGQAKTAPNDTAVYLPGKIVSAANATEGYIYVQEPDRSSGIRVNVPGSGLVPGDFVNVFGQMGCALSNGANCLERQVTAAGVWKVNSGSPPAPLGVTCSQVGGAALGSYTLPVGGGIGLCNVGLLVRIVGHVNYKDAGGTYIAIDDSSAIPDPTGSSGVLVQLPAARPDVVVGTFVEVTGVVEAYSSASPTRRFVRPRTAQDVKTSADLGWH